MKGPKHPRGPPMTLGNMRCGHPPDWIKVKNPDAPGGSNGGPGDARHV